MFVNARGQRLQNNIRVNDKYSRNIPLQYSLHTVSIFSGALGYQSIKKDLINQGKSHIFQVPVFYIKSGNYNVVEKAYHNFDFNV